MPTNKYRSFPFPGESFNDDYLFECLFGVRMMKMETMNMVKERCVPMHSFANHSLFFLSLFHYIFHYIIVLSFRGWSYLINYLWRYHDEFISEFFSVLAWYFMIIRWLKSVFFCWRIPFGASNNIQGFSTKRNKFNESLHEYSSVDWNFIYLLFTKINWWNIWTEIHLHVFRYVYAIGAIYKERIQKL